jgi:hypothetical protein
VQIKGQINQSPRRTNSNTTEKRLYEEAEKKRIHASRGGESKQKGREKGTRVAPSGRHLKEQKCICNNKMSTLDHVIRHLSMIVAVLIIT